MRGERQQRVHDPEDRCRLILRDRHPEREDERQERVDARDNEDRVLLDEVHDVAPIDG